MNVIKSPYQLLLEHLGLGPVQQTLSPQEMQAEMIARGQTPQVIQQPQQPLYMAEGGVAEQVDTVYDPVTGLPLYGQVTRERHRGPIPKTARVSDEVLRNIAALPVGAGMGGASTLASALQMMGLPQFQEARKVISQGVSERAPIGSSVGDVAGSFFADPLGRMATSNMVAKPVASTGYAALQGFMQPTEQAGVVGEPFRERLQNAGTNAAFNTGILGLLHSPKLLRLLKNKAPQFNPE